ncbi:A disintegrin and metalloproteinase with thrombospondin motifs 12 [Anguilla anguilla]|uniref:A disintegrin and metalloproteinase with thrombospondin motifs 12 n=1 Tax=Anguilla anguilla TaxID=7936 RepID=UPI0015AC2FE8|nr:A disintegrin and metalloproteinase with thrombospondin motifs 12 [Anguilla anguilla]
MQCLLESRVLFLLKLVFFLATGHVECFQPDSFYFPDTEQENFIRSHPEFSVVHPEKVSRDGEFVSFSLTHHFDRGRSKRDLDAAETYVYYKVPHGGWNLTFNLSVNSHLLSDQYVLERRPGVFNGTRQRQVSGHNACHLLGRVTNSSVQGTAAVSTCNGLKGFFSLPDGNFFIEPVRGFEAGGGTGHEPHVVYRSSAGPVRHRLPRSAESGGRSGVCGLKDTLEESRRVEREREQWESEQVVAGGPRRMVQRSVSRERWVETLAVADSKLIEYHGSDNVESYIFTIMNMVTGIFHDASIGNAIHIVLVRLILLQEDEKGLKIMHHADTTLSSFCSWQKNINPQSDSHPAHHDVAVLVTRKDICAGLNQPCETLGLSHLSGMCQPHRSCNINEDSGLPVAFTVAHELGHSFGIHHDGQGNDCELDGKHPFIMSRQLKYDTSPLTWSPCSKEYITRFLDRGWGSCLDDRPSKKDLTTPLVAPGVRYTTHHQCQLQYGPNATFCQEVENMCQILWCSVNSSCRSKLDAPADGTRCGQDKWCISGECVVVGKLPETVNGGWGAWSAWSHCSRTCGAGVQAANRECNKPKPEFGGKYCTGERKRYRVCNTKPCAKERPSFREMQCSEFDTVPYQNELYEWVPVPYTATPCELHCRPVDEQFSEKMLDAVLDGTPCFTLNHSRSICVNGVCKDVGCDYGIDSNAMEDRCGVCLGDGTTCQTVHKEFDGGEGYGYVDVGLIPEGARDILVQEVQESGNFLALRGQDPEEYYLNGRYIIQWNGDYKAGGALFHYERKGNLENLTSSGPTKEPIMIQLLYQEKNPGIRYEYTIKKRRQKGNEVILPEYRWKFGAWTDCSTSCGAGLQHQPVRCFEAEVGVVEESLCNADKRPEDRHRRCKKMDCPARWWVGGWQPCSATCGPSGVKKRTVLCVRTVGGEERVLNPGDCRSLLKPKPVVPCHRDLPCGSEWAVGSWGECPVTCGGGVRSRTVTCVTAPKVRCNITSKPRSKSLCALQSCPSSTRKKVWRVVPKATTLAPKTQPWGPYQSSSTVAPSPTAPATLPTTTNNPATSPTTNPATSPTTTTNNPEPNAVDEGGVTPIPSPAGWESGETGVTEEEEGSTPNFLLSEPETVYTPGCDQATAATEDEVEIGATTRASRTVTTPKTGATSTVTFTTSSPHTSTPRTLRAMGQYPRTAPKPPPFIKPDTKWRPRTAGGPGGGGPGGGGPRGTQRSRPGTPERGSTPEVIHPTVRVLKTGLRSTTVPPRKSSASPLPKGHHPRVGAAVNYRSDYETAKPNAKPIAKPTAKPIARPTAKPIAKATPKPIAKATTKPIAKATTKPIAKATTKPIAKATTKPIAKSTTKPIAKSTTKPIAKATTKPIAKATTKPIAKSTTKPIAKSTAKPTSKATAKPTARPTPKPTAMADVSWVVGNWSECSTTCGLGAVWRTVTCSSGRDSDCASLNMPEPARRCQLRPCATWHSGNWSKCPEGCLGGTRHRDVQCIDNQSKRQLRPFHCQALAYKPQNSLPCAPLPCLDWHTSPWGQCSKSCGEGLKERLVYCPEYNRCHPAQRPNSTEACSQRRCSQWVTEDWEECTASCGGGVQHRVVRCVGQSGEPQLGDSGSQCEKRTRPDSFRKCNLRECRRRPVPWCSKDSMSTRFCEKLKLLGRCDLSSIRKQCCITCAG